MNTKSIFIEISGKCTAKCPYCAQFRLKQENHFGEIMSPILFEQIIDHIFKIGIINKNDPPTINLFNWGDPFLNPNINDILRILKKNKLKAFISSNFIVVPDIDKELLPVIESATFSLSGFSQASYSRIHGGSLKKVINNFEKFYDSIRKYSPKTWILIYWHRYFFNENEFWEAHKYFNRPGISIGSVIAYLNDDVMMKKFIKGELSEEFIKKAEKDIFLDLIKKGVINHKKKSLNYYCPQWDYIVIDESGQLLLCCGVTSYDSETVLGNILNMSSEEIMKTKLNHSFCKECISSGIAHYRENSDASLPSGGGLYGLRVKFFYKFRKTIGQTLVKASFGRKIIYIIRNL